MTNHDIASRIDWILQNPESLNAANQEPCGPLANTRSLLAILSHDIGCDLKAESPQGPGYTTPPTVTIGDNASVGTNVTEEIIRLGLKGNATEAAPLADRATEIDNVGNRIDEALAILVGHDMGGDLRPAELRIARAVLTLTTAHIEHCRLFPPKD